MASFKPFKFKSTLANAFGAVALVTGAVTVNPLMIVGGVALLAGNALNDADAFKKKKPQPPKN